MCGETGIRQDGVACRSMGPADTSMVWHVSESDCGLVYVLTSTSRFSAVCGKYVREALFSVALVSDRERHLVFLGEAGSANS